MTGLACVFLLVLAVAYSQECGASPPLTAENMPAQKVAYVQIETGGDNGYRALMKLGFDGLTATMKARYPKSSIDFFLCTETNCLNGIDLSSYTQVLVNDMSYQSDNAASQMAGYAKIANWYTTTMQNPTIICDGRIRSSLWSGRYAAFNNAVPISAGNPRPNHRLWENYFVNLGIRGGGLLLATDHAPGWTMGINEINKQIGIAEFVRDFDAQPYALEIDESSPVLSYPTDASDFTYSGKRYLWDDSSTGDAPISEQKNGKIMYPVGWHGSIGFNRPGVSSTIRGSIGFLVDITAPKCGALVIGGTAVTFTAVKKAGANDVASWVWTSNVQGQIGTGASFSISTLSPGQHIVKVKAKDTQQFVAEAQVVVFITFSSGKAECIVTARDGQQVQEYFPIQRSQAVTSWYQYGTPTAKEPNDSDKIENIPLTGNLALYNDNKGYSLVFIGSKNAGPATITLRISLTDVVKTTKVAAKIQLVDDTGDRWLDWDETTNTGTARITEWQGTSKGFVIGPFPDAKTDRWCINVEVDVASVTGLNFINTWGHIRNSDTFPSPVLLGHSAYGATTTKKFQFCRALCTCGASELRDKMAGVIEPVRVNPGDGGSIGSIYRQGLLCTWNISPKDAAGKAPAGGIILWYSAPFNVANEDSVNVYKGVEGGPAVYQALKGTTLPSAKIVDGPQATVVFTTTNVLKTQYGFILNYAAMPKLTSAAPIRGPLTEPTTVVLTGESFVDNPDFRVRVTYGGGKTMDLIPAKITPTSVTVSIPPQNVGTATISVSNDKDSGALGFTGAVAYNWFDASCGAIKTCAGCAKRKDDCGWCNNADPTLSACIPIGGNTPCPGDAKNLDIGCCTRCSLLNGCNGGGKCDLTKCDDTCVCDDKHWGADCSCKQCVKGTNGAICSGNGNCDCKTGACVCKAGWRGEDCSCKTCEGNPPCSGNGVCNCDGTCSCNAGWTHVGVQKICDCSTTCPNDCSKKGVCKCGSCECDAGYDLLPDCSCKDCDQVCGDNQVCNCQGKCECNPGFKGANCTEKTDCGKLDNCKDCAKNTDCGWCDEMNVCENIFAPVACADKDEPGSKNPRDFKLITAKELCEEAVIADKENLSDNKSSALIGAVVGTLGVAALGLMAMAYFLRPEAAAPGMLGADLSHLAGEGFINSAIHTEAGTGGSSGIFQA